MPKDKRGRELINSPDGTIRTCLTCGYSVQSANPVDNDSRIEAHTQAAHKKSKKSAARKPAARKPAARKPTAKKK